MNESYEMKCRKQKVLKQTVAFIVVGCCLIVGLSLIVLIGEYM